MFCGFVSDMFYSKCSPLMMYLLCNKIIYNFKLIAGLILVCKFGNIRNPVGVTIRLLARRPRHVGSIPGRGTSFFSRQCPHQLSDPPSLVPSQYQG
jgi:hypothetical protein